ncbi:MAG: PhoH family protein [Clostridia bacterium]|nr:PhoH family protein [Clostridia bacterium]
MDFLQKLLGNLDENLGVVTRELSLIANVEGASVKLTGEESAVKLGARVLENLLCLIEEGEAVDKTRVAYCLELAREGKTEDISKLIGGVIAITAKGKQIKCKTVGQKKYVEEIKNNTVVFGIGPAGTGKTYLAVCMAVAAFKSRQVEKIILTRPAVEAGEKLGFLPGDLQNKVDPYLRPLYDALQELFGLENYAKLIERGVIEIAPLAYMRGRTLSNAFIILDEAQNTTKEQMKMFLTRMGEGSKVVVTGDLTQVDLPGDRVSGLRHAVRVLADVKDIGICKLTDRDVVRHPLVMQIVRAYERDGKEKK